MNQRNTQQLLADTLQELHSAGIDAWIFGGWAEELWGLRLPGLHSDIDLLYPAEDFSLLDRFLPTRADLEEVLGKRFVHKRAFIRQNVLVEIFLVRPTLAGSVTDFFGLHPLYWPEETLSQAPLLGVPTPAASPAALRFYREQHKSVEQAYQKYLGLKEARDNG